MKTLSLRTQVVVAALLLTSLSLGAGVSYRIRKAYDQNLKEAYEQDLLVLAELPRLRGRLRQADLAADKYLLTGNEDWLPTRDVALRGVRKDLGDLGKLLKDPNERRVLEQLAKQLGPYLTRQDKLIERRRAGKMTQAEAEAIASSKRNIEEIVDLVMTMKDVSLEELQESRKRAEEASRATFFLILFVGVAASGAVTLILGYLVVRPVVALERNAKEWQLGKPWRPIGISAGPEIAELDRQMGELATRLNEQYQLRSQLVSLASHEFNNALNVLANVGFLLEETEKDRGQPSREHYYVMFKSHLRALTEVVNNLLNLGRVESGRFAVRPRRMEMRHVMKDAQDRLELLAQRKELAVELEVPDKPVPVWADQEALSLVVTNLLNNAIKYTPNGGRIVMSVRPEGERLRVSFQDSGIGIAKEDIEKITEGYYRTAAGKAAAKGFGIGLSLVRQILEAHDTKLRVESEPGKGSTFSFDLPVYSSSVSKGETDFGLPE